MKVRWSVSWSVMAGLFVCLAAAGGQTQGGGDLEVVRLGSVVGQRGIHAWRTPAAGFGVAKW